MKDPHRVAIARLGMTTRWHSDNADKMREARRELVRARLERDIKLSLGSDTPPTADERRQLAELLAAPQDLQAKFHANDARIADLEQRVDERERAHAAAIEPAYSLYLTMGGE